ncbi:MAG TPA: NAD(+) kinase [Clostridiales bacterium]|nr:NAD(+) kinase [Clostridiales bacterium]
MDKFYIITNRDKDQNLRFTEEIVQYLKEHGKKCQVQQAERRVEGEYHYTDPALIPEDTQCILVLGGDGTLLQAARDVVHREIPMLGINLGTLGFLAEIDKTSIYTALDKLFADDYEIEERMMLHAVLLDGKETTALNDIVVTRASSTLKILDLDIFIDDEYVDDFKADGIIVATPTGSTAYSLSAGGPIVDPSLNSMIVTPVCPHKMYSRTIIVPPEKTVTVKCKAAIDNEAVVAADSEILGKLSGNETVVIQIAQKNFKLIRFKGYKFFSVLHNKLVKKES